LLKQQQERIGQQTAGGPSNAMNFGEIIKYVSNDSQNWEFFGKSDFDMPQTKKDLLNSYKLENKRAKTSVDDY